MQKPTLPSFPPIRYGFHEAKTKWETLKCCGTFLRAWAHNPFGSDDQFNKKLKDRELKYLDNEYIRSITIGPEFINKTSKSIKLKTPYQYNEAILKSLANEIVKDVIYNCEKEIDVTWEKIAPAIQKSTALKVDQLFPKLPNLDEKTEALISALKGEFIFSLGLFVLEAAFAAISPEYAFSLTASTGMASFAISLFIVMSTMPFVLGLLEGTWRQFASYRDSNGPKTLNEAGQNIFQHARKSWDEAVDSDKTFHPVVSALLNSAFIIATWSPLASYKIASHAVFYLLLDSYLCLKASLIEGKDAIVTWRDFVIACIGGISRGLFKDMQKTTAYGTSYTVRGSYHDALITFNCVVFGQVFRTVLSQFWSLKDLLLTLGVFNNTENAPKTKED